MLPGLAPGSLLGGGPPRMDPGHSGRLGALALAHHPHQPPQQQQQQQPPTAASYNHLGLYPIVWQYPNGAHSYPALGLPAAKWGHPDTGVSSEACLRRNSPNPWLHQHTPVTTSDSLGILSHVSVRPASADPHLTPRVSHHASPPPSKTTEELEKRAFLESMRAFAPAYPKPDPDRMPRHFLDPLSGQQRALLDAGDRASKYKEESRRILQESIEVAPYTAKIRPGDGDREPYPGRHALLRDMEATPSDLYGLKPHSVTLHGYFTTDPPRPHPHPHPHPHSHPHLTPSRSSAPSWRGWAVAAPCPCWPAPPRPR
ncbi:hypothetical protein AAFF_G00280150 [Aldrovandia affinis]|uniref:Uncharacterized protein n=1 Tax=Aldrovandia affinis TaxID=143900 RepID=A0AAD7RCS5_9TELE|nr:hypothetical protein AAFF_G00280150 [Aldrovandia affinis]